MRKISLFLILLLTCIGFMTSCGRDENSSLMAEQPKVSVDWKKEGFAVSGDVEEKQEFWIREYIPWEYENVNIDTETEQLLFLDAVSSTCVYGGKIYRLNSVINPPYIQAVRWVMEIYDTETMSSSVREFSYEQLGQETMKNSYLVDMDVVEDGNFVFQWAEMGENSDGLIHQTVNRMIYSNLQDDVHVTDLWDIYLEKGIVRESFSEYIVLPQGYCVCDSEGNTYAKAGESSNGYTGLYVIDSEGNILFEYQAKPEQAIGEPMRTESGELIYPVYDAEENCYIFMWPDTENQEMRTLGEISGSQYIKQMYGMQGNNVYYEISDGIVKWDIKSGKRTLVFGYQENGIASGYQTMLVLREGQTPLLRLYRNVDEQQEDWLAPLYEEEVQKDEAVRVVDLVSSNPGSRQISECAALVSRRDLNKTFVYESAGQDAEDFRTKIMAELVAGGGPDILYVSRSDMEMLQEKGMLLDLKDLIPQDILEGLLPGVIELGTRDGNLVGLAGNVNAYGMAVSRDTWAEDTWLLEDMVELMEEGSMESAVYYTEAGTYFAPLAFVRLLTEFSLEDSFLIDWENRESHFEDERFIRLLEITNRKRENLSDESDTWLNDGKRAAFFSLGSIDDIYDFGTCADREDGHFVGFPTEGVSGNYLDTSGVLVVNANTDNVEKLGTYLEYFLGEEIQSICDSGINPALRVCRLSTEEIEEQPEGGYLWRGGALSVMEDGTTSLHRAKAFLESCVPAPRQYPELNNIIYEELEAMYAENKNPKQVAEIIDNRIQTYLDEEN